MSKCCLVKKKSFSPIFVQIFNFSIAFYLTNIPLTLLAFDYQEKQSVLAQSVVPEAMIFNGLRLFLTGFRFADLFFPDSRGALTSHQLYSLLTNPSLPTRKDIKNRGVLVGYLPPHF